MRDLMVCYALLKQFASMLDAVEVLIRAGAVHASFVPASVAFEVSLYIEWILVSDGDNKANHYYVGTLREERMWGLRVQGATSEGSEFLEKMGQLGADILGQRPALDAEGAAHVKDVERILALADYASTNAAFEIYKKTHPRIKHEPEWYKVLGKRSIAEIAKELQRTAEYIIYYGQGSQVTHSISYKDHFKFLRKGVTAQPIRNVKDIHTAFNFAFTTAMLVFNRVLGFYRPSELKAFATQYLNEWRAAFTNIPTAIIKDADE